ncbi:ALBINO3-like protein 3, mitochondrial [Tasmannia lanceolata]|uniref:ALBINO3-like protein 3, mitochondrial n=1 Tax=Tasmannia lanceolata TaxID=3420 RepID=UPI00406350AE
MLFRKERRAIGCPSNLWLFVPFCIQGGMLWFQNLTEFPHGVLGPIFPILIACLHFMNVQISFRNTSLGSFPGVIGLLARGSLVYWLTNSSLNVVQQLSLKHPYILKQLGLPARNVPQEHKMSTENLPPAKPFHPLSLKHPYNLQKLGLPATSLPLEHKAPTENLPPDELLAVALQHLDMGHQDEALPLLRVCSPTKALLPSDESPPTDSLLRRRRPSSQVKYKDLLIGI